MDKFKVLLIRQRKAIYLFVLIVLIVTFYSYFNLNECVYDIWKIISDISKSISDRQIPSKWNHMILTAIFLLFPVIVTYAILFFLFPIQPWDILNLIGKKRNNSSKLCYAMLETQLSNFIQQVQDLSRGILVPQDEVNKIQEKVLPILSNKSWFITSLLEPDELWNDYNNKNSLEYSVVIAKDRGIKLNRYIVTKKLEDVKKEINTDGSFINEISKLHEQSEHKLFLIPEDKFKQCRSACGIDKEYLDFLLVVDEIVIGLKNNKDTYKTITSNENYYLFVKDTEKELVDYKKFISQINSFAFAVETHPTPPFN